MDWNVRTLARNLILLLALAALLGYLAHRFRDAQNGTDFPEFYAAAKMVREGAGHQLYDAAAQDRFQIRYAGRTGTYFNHPPFEALLYIPLTECSLQHAYWLWCLLNAAFLVVVARMLQSNLFTTWDWRILLALSFLFVPVLLSFLQGQDSLLLLLLFVSAYAALRRGQGFAAGCLLAFGLFKFHLVLPVMVVLLVGKVKKVAYGFALVGLLLVLISVAVSGWGVLAAYPRFLMQLRNLPRAGIYPQAMANLRGVAAVCHFLTSPAKEALTLISSLLVLLIGMLGWKASGLNWEVATDLAFGNAVVAAVLVAYHLSPHDLCVLLLPMGLILQHLLTATGIAKSRLALLAAVEIVLFLPPLHVFLLSRHTYAYGAIPVLLLFLASYGEVRRLSTAMPLSR